MRDRWILLGLCLLLILLWLPGLSWPITSDTSLYALLGRSAWTTGRYALFDEPYAKHLPMQAFFSYPFTVLAGYQWGMKLSSLFAGFGVIAATYLLGHALFGRAVALLAAALVTMHHAFVLMTILGSADLLFTTFFTLCLYATWRANEDDRWYILAGVSAGIASLARYNGMPLFALIGLWTLLKHPSHLRSLRFWIGLFVGVGSFSLWLIRNAIVFGDPLHTEYTKELALASPSLLTQFLSNSLYYIQPQHNLLPIAFLLALYGLWRAPSDRRWFLIAGMAAAWVLTAIWWVQAMRFAFPGYVLALILAGYGFVDLWRRYPRWRVMGASIVVGGILVTHSMALCLYAYGSCNTRFDQTVGWLPADLGLSSEGLYTWTIARDWLNAHAPEGAIVGVMAPENAIVWSEGVFREDMRILHGSEHHCPQYRITQQPKQMDTILYETDAHPVTYVVQSLCETEL